MRADSYERSDSKTAPIRGRMVSARIALADARRLEILAAATLKAHTFTYTHKHAPESDAVQ